MTTPAFARVGPSDVALPTSLLPVPMRAMTSLGPSGLPPARATGLRCVSSASPPTRPLTRSSMVRGAPPPLRLRPPRRLSPRPGGEPTLSAPGLLVELAAPTRPILPTGHAIHVPGHSRMPLWGRARRLGMASGPFASVKPPTRGPPTLLGETLADSATPRLSLPGSTESTSWWPECGLNTRLSRTRGLPSWAPTRRLVRPLLLWRGSMRLACPGRPAALGPARRLPPARAGPNPIRPMEH